MVPETRSLMFLETCIISIEITFHVSRPSLFLYLNVTSIDDRILKAAEYLSNPTSIKLLDFLFLVKETTGRKFCFTFSSQKNKVYKIQKEIMIGSKKMYLPLNVSFSSK